MQEFFPHMLVNNIYLLRSAVTMRDRPRLVTVETKPGEPVHMPADPSYTEPLGQLREVYKRSAQKLHDEAVKLQLKTSWRTLDRMLKSLGEESCTIRELADDVEELQGRLVDELVYTKCFVLWGRSEELYLAKHLFGEKVSEQFPTTQIDIEEAGKCLALDRATACVFHLMRVLEMGLQALATDLGITKIERNWHQLLQDVEARIRDLPRKTEEEKNRLADRSAATAHLRNVKDAWRNDVMHPRDVYTVEQATDIFNHTKALMCSVAVFLSWPVQ